MPRGYGTPDAQRLAVLKGLSAGRPYSRITEETGTSRSTISSIAGVAIAQGKLKPRARGRPKLK